jgi:hypothetical protein
VIAQHRELIDFYFAKMLVAWNELNEKAIRNRRGKSHKKVLLNKNEQALLAQ